MYKRAGAALLHGADVPASGAKGRTQQFHQIGIEVLGRGDAFIDAEILLLLSDLFRAVGLTEPSLQQFARLFGVPAQVPQALLAF
jgi:hypothetical protein